MLNMLGIKKAGMHAFRHGQVSYIVEQGVSRDIIKAWIWARKRSDDRTLLASPEFVPRGGPGERQVIAAYLPDGHAKHIGHIGTSAAAPQRRLLTDQTV
jgi:hypothetical protein